MKLVIALVVSIALVAVCIVAVLSRPARAENLKDRQRRLTVHSLGEGNCIALYREETNYGVAVAMTAVSCPMEWP